MTNKIRIDRQKWVRGLNFGVSQMLNDKGRMCCLGHFGAQILGWTNEQMFMKSYPRNCTDQDSVLTCKVDPYNREHDFHDIDPKNGTFNSLFALKAAALNDRDKDDTTIELSLIAHFKENGYELEFYN